MWLAYLHIQRGSYELHEIAHLTERKNHALLFCCQPPWLTLRTLTFYKPGNHHQPMNDASARIAAALQRIATALDPIRTLNGASRRSMIRFRGSTTT